MTSTNEKENDDSTNIIAEKKAECIANLNPAPDHEDAWAGVMGDFDEEGNIVTNFPLLDPPAERSQAQQEHKAGESGESKDETNGEDKGAKMVDIGLRLVQQNIKELFVDQFDTPFAAIKVTYNGSGPEHIQTIPVNKNKFKRWVLNMTSAAKPDFLTYRNSSSGLTIQYPSYWEKTEDGNAVIFHTPYQSDLDRYQERLWITTTELSELFRPNMTLDKFSDSIIGEYNDTLKNFRLIGLDSRFMVGGGNNAAYKFQYTNTLRDSNIDLELMDIITTNGNKVYHITYAAEPNEFSNYMPVIQNMLNSINLNDIAISTDSAAINPQSSGAFTNLSGGEPLADHTLMVYMIGSDLESKSYAATQDISELKQAGSSPNINVIIETGGGDSQATINQERFIDFTKVQRHKILKNDLETLSDLGQQNMGDPRTLSDFIIWGLSEFPAKRYSIILWDHGSGINGFGKDISFNNDVLNLDELEKAFNDSKKVVQTEFELIGFDACLMASVEVANRVKSAAKFMVSSEELEPTWGWNYTTILKELTKDPTQNGVSLGRTIVDSFAKHSQSLGASQEFGAHKEITLSVIRLANIDQLIGNLANLSTYLGSNIVDFPSAISLAHSVDFTERYGQSAHGGSGLVDIHDLASNIREILPESAQVVDNVHASLKNAIIYKINGEARPNANGLSIYMPLQEEEFSDSSKYSLDIWRKIVDLQYNLIKSDKEIPIVETDIQGKTIIGKIYSNDVSSVTLNIHGFMEGGNRAFYEELEPSSFINNDNGSFEYSWKNQVLSLCNSEEICSPTLMDLEVNKDKKFAHFPVVLKSDIRNNEEFATLIYEINDNGKGFEFLGAIPEIKGHETIPKEKWALDATDEIRTLTFAFENEDPSDINYAAYPSMQVTDKFEPRYVTYNGTFDISFKLCDYSNNCWVTESFRLGGMTEKIEPQPAISRYNSKNSTDKEKCQATESNFSIYDNPNLGFKIEYPSNWEKIEEGLLDPWVVAFLYPPREQWQSLINIGVENWISHESLEEFYESTAKSFPFSKIVESNATIVGDNAGHKLAFTSVSGGQEKQDMFVSTVVDGRLYEINFRSNSPKFSDEYFNIIQKMVDSFEIYAANKEQIDQDQGSTCIPYHEQRVEEGRQYSGDTLMTGNFSEYESPHLGFKIKYPFNWKIGEDPESNRITFFTPAERQNDTSALVGDNFIEQIGITRFQANGLSPLSEFVNTYIYKIKEDQLGFNLVESNSTSFRGNAAYVIVFTLFDPELRIQIKQMSVLTLVGNTTYLFEYFAESPNYERYLPTIEAMIDSFETPPDLRALNSTDVI